MIKKNNSQIFIVIFNILFRSPLSTTILGLDFLIDKLKESPENESTKLIFETIKDAKLGCDVATDTLNDFLLYDKIQCKMVDIDPTLQNGWEFVKDCVRPFVIQVMNN